MKNIFKTLFDSPIHLGIAWMVVIIAIFIISMLLRLDFVPTWLLLILMAPGFSMVIAEREPESLVGQFGLYLHNILNIFGDGKYVPEPNTLDADEYDNNEEYGEDTVEQQDDDMDAVNQEETEEDGAQYEDGMDIPEESEDRR